MNKFIASLIPSLDFWYLQYTGNKAHLKKTIDQNWAMEWYSYTKEFLVEDTMSVSLFWQKITKKMLFLKPEFTEWCESIQEELNKILKTYSKWWIISDEYFQILNKIFRSTEAVRVVLEWWAEIYGFIKRWNADTPFFGNVDIKLDEHVLSVNVEQNIFELTEDDYRYSNVMLLLKEVTAGFVSFRTHSIVTQSWQTWSQQKFKIGQDIKIHVKGQTIISVEAKETEYDIDKIEWWWTIFHKGLAVCPSDDFVPIVTEEQKDGSLFIYLYWAYTHILRKVMWFNPQTWQFKYLMEEKRLNTVAGCRRAGKTMLSSYKIFRRMYRNPSNKKHRHRQPKLFYLAPSEDKFKAVLDYIDASTEAIKILKILKYNVKDKRLRLFDEYLDRNRKPMSRVVATCDFVSAKWYEPARWNWSDEIICDEAGFISEDVYLNILPIIENEQADFYAISTIDWETPKHWFYETLTEYEQMWDVDWFAMRVTIDDIDSNIISESSKERMKRALKNNPQRFYAELYATFPSINSVFNTTHLFIVPNEHLTPTEVIIWYDPAKRSDFWWVVIWEIYDTDEWKIMHIVDEFRIQGDYHPYQKDFLMNLKSSYINQWVKVNMIMDATSAWDVVAEIMGNLVDVKVWYTGTSTRPEIDKYWCWKYAKKNLVHMLQILMDTKRVKAYTHLKYLIEEMRNFKMIHTSSGNVKYEAVTWHDDIVNAVMLCWFYFWFILWQFSTIQYDTDLELRSYYDQFQRNDNLYKWNYQRISWYAEPDTKRIYTF